MAELIMVNPSQLFLIFMNLYIYFPVVWYGIYIRQFNLMHLGVKQSKLSHFVYLNMTFKKINFKYYINSISLYFLDAKLTN